jgi:hypothetical protein
MMQRKGLLAGRKALLSLAAISLIITVNVFFAASVWKSVLYDKRLIEKYLFTSPKCKLMFLPAFPFVDFVPIKTDASPKQI